MSVVDPIAVESGALPGSDTSTAEIVRRTEQEVRVMPLMTNDEMSRYWRLAQGLAASRMFKDANQAEQAFAKILIGRDLGLSPTRALMTIDLVKGAIQLRGVLLAAWVRQSPNYDYDITEQTHKTCTVVMSRLTKTGEWRECPPETFTIDDAKLAGLVKDESNWSKYPKNMCFWRALSNAVKFHAPELFAGMPVYVEGELEPLKIESSTGDPAATLPDELAGLVQRAGAIDSHAWRANEVLARLPHPRAENYQEAVDQIVAEVTAWLDEHPAPDPEPEDAEVVDGEPVDETAPAAVSDPDEIGTDIQERYRTDEEWRSQVDVLLNRRADLEVAMDDAANGSDDRRVQEAADELDVVNGNLDALGVPGGWFPVSDEQSQLEV